MPDPAISTYTVTQPDGTRLGPFSLKGLRMQHTKGAIADTDLVDIDGQEGRGIPLASILSGETANSEPSRSKTTLPPAKPRSKPQLPPKKERSGDETLPAEDSLFGPPGPDGYGPAPSIPSPMGRAIVCSFLTAMLLILLLLRAYITSSISGSLILEVDLHSRLADFRDMEGLLSGFLITITVLTGLSFLFWLYRAASNAFELTEGRFSIPPSSLIISWFIPVYNLWAVYSQTRYLVNASIDPSGETLRRHRPGVMLWWALCLAAIICSILAQEPAISTIDQAKAWFDWRIWGDILSAVALIATILLVLSISARQKYSDR